jgi:hypothetical protein
VSDDNYIPPAIIGNDAMTRSKVLVPIGSNQRLSNLASKSLDSKINSSLLQ